VCEQVKGNAKDMYYPIKADLATGSDCMGVYGHNQGSRTQGGRVGIHIAGQNSINGFVVTLRIVTWQKQRVEIGDTGIQRGRGCTASLGTERSF